MPQYTLSAPEERIIVSWLFEPSGYLDQAVNSVGTSAHSALIATPTLDIYTWIHNGVSGPDTSDWVECGMVWWIRKHSNLNVTRPQRPPESAQWIAILNQWDASINAGFGNVPQNQRDGNTVTLTAEDGSTTTMPAGSQLSAQQSIITKVLSVLQ